MPFHWTCPYCDRDTTITSTRSQSNFTLTIENSVGYRYFQPLLVVCPNPKCKKFTLDISMFEYRPSASPSQSIGDFIQAWKLIPPSAAKVFPDYVPSVIRDDYIEACLIRDLSPKASATLSRRCLQGMIRDFWKTKPGRLVDEIDEIEDKTDPLTWAAINSVRKIGNIGAHMEKDINLIVDVEPTEAQMLIGLIELLIKDWYITQHDRQERLNNIVQASALKDAIKAGNS